MYFACVCAHAVRFCMWMFIRGSNRLALIRIVFDYVTMGHGGFVDNASVLRWKTSVLGPENIY